jgi:trk system potassium uptake protein TrkH
MNDGTSLRLPLWSRLVSRLFLRRSSLAFYVTTGAFALDLAFPSAHVGLFSTALQGGVVAWIVGDAWKRRPWRTSPLRTSAIVLATLAVSILFVLAKVDVLVEAFLGEVDAARAGEILRTYGAVVAAASGASLYERSSERMKFLSRLALRPVQTIVLSYAAAIVLGTLLLALPFSLRETETASLFDALFVATSAVSVTGLSVVDIPSTYSSFGLLVLIVLIQLGGLGIMFLFAAFAVLSGRKLTAKREHDLAETLGADASAGFRRSLRFIVIVTLGVEFVGALLLLPAMAARMDVPSAVFHALFHSVSAFCNAGISSLAGGLGDASAGTLCVIASLAIVGGLGTPVLLPLWLRLRGSLRVLGLHAKLALWTTAVLLAAGLLGFLALEGSRALGGLAPLEKVGHALFLSASARTSGFQITSIPSMSPATLFWLMLLGLIGASPGSTGGGLKTTTFAVLALSVAAVLRRRSEVAAFGRTVPKEDILRAVALLWSGLFVLAIGILLLLALEPDRPLAVIFEAVSAFTTTGMTLGLTPELSPAARLVVMGLMVVGRLGALTLLAAFFDRRRPAEVHYPAQHVQFG